MDSSLDRNLQRARGLLVWLGVLFILSLVGLVIAPRPDFLPGDAIFPPLDLPPREGLWLQRAAIAGAILLPLAIVVSLIWAWQADRREARRLELRVLEQEREIADLRHERETGALQIQIRELELKLEQQHQKDPRG